MIYLVGLYVYICIDSMYKMGSLMRACQEKNEWLSIDT
jgi:hypothetical protein